MSAGTSTDSALWPADAPAADAPTSPAAPREGGKAGVWWGRIKLWLAVALTLCVAGSVFVLYERGTDRGTLDPDAPTPDGSHAAAVLLRAHGVTIDEQKTVSDALEKAERGDVTLLIPFAQLLSTESVQRLTELPSSVRVVLVEPDPFTLDDLDVGVEIKDAESYARVRDPGCDLAEASSAGSAEMGYYNFKVDDKATTCYGRGLVSTSRGGAEIVILGARDPLTNDRLDEAGNAALMVGLLSAHDDLIWLLPSAPEPQSQAQRVELVDLLPTWTGGMAVLLVAALGLGALWRSRRLGPPVTEPLPVVVRSTETVEGRARLYRRARARTEAHHALRAGAFARILPPLGLGSEPDYRAVVESVADRTGRPTAQIYAVLFGPPPADDAALVAAADMLDALVTEILKPASAETATHPDGEGRPQ